MPVNKNLIKLYRQWAFFNIYIKILTSIRGSGSGSGEAETREITLGPKGIRRFFWVFSFTALQPRSEAEYLIYRKWATEKQWKYKQNYLVIDILVK
jgi:hypothetical protein